MKASRLNRAALRLALIATMLGVGGLASAQSAEPAVQARQVRGAPDIPPPAAGETRARLNSPDPRLRGAPVMRTTAAPAGAQGEATVTATAAVESPTAEAQDTPESRREAALTRRGAAREARIAARAKGPEAVQADRELRATEHRNARWERLRERCAIESPTELEAPVRNELTRHARRVARLERLRELAVEGGKAPLVEKIDALAVREDALHERRLATLVPAEAEAGAEASAETPATETTQGAAE